VLHRPLSLWEAYRLQAIVLGALIVLQSLLIAALLVQAIRRRRAEIALDRSRDDFRRVSESTAAVPWEADVYSWTFTFVGPQATKLLGYPVERWYEKDFWVQQIHPEDRAATIETCLARSQTLDDFEFEYRMLASSGATVWVHDVVHCERRNGALTVLRGLLLDVTERKLAERTLRESEERFRLMADTAPVMIWMSGPDGLFSFFNKGWLDFTGRTLEQELGNGWTEGVHREDLDRCLATYTASFGARREFKMEYHLRYADGSDRLVLDTGMPRFASDGVFAGFIGTVIDITDLKRAEADVQHQRAELAHGSRISALGELAASLAHELNQPLTAILSNAQAARLLLASDDTPPLNAVRVILDDIIDDNRRADEIIRRMRALAKKDPPDLAPLDLAAILREVVTLVHSDAVLRNVRLRLNLGETLPAVHGNKVQLQQVTLNLLLNAFDAMKETSVSRREVLLHAKLSAHMVEVAVRDHGTGLSAEVAQRLFEPFYTTKREGLGMGLSISRSIIEAHHGRLWAENHATGGTTFYFTVPLQQGV
jgi:PAS domain S-box-containing protein